MRKIWNLSYLHKTFKAVKDEDGKVIGREPVYQRLHYTVAKSMKEAYDCRREMKGQGMIKVHIKSEMVPG